MALLIVIADTSPILYLLLIEQLELLPRLYATITIPTTVQAEMQAAGAPTALQQWIARPPAWLFIQPAPPSNDLALQRLDAGERDARRIAQQLGLNVTGVLGILGIAARHHWIDFPETINRLVQATNFRASPESIQALLAEFS